MCGLMTHSEQFLNRAGTASGEHSPKKKFSSLSALFSESEPWTALKRLLWGTPYLARMLLGAFAMALSTTVGPMNSLHFAIPLSATNSNPKTGPLNTNSIKPSKKCFPY